MTASTRNRLIAAGGILVALVSAYSWGAWGKGAMAHTIQTDTVRTALLEGRADVLDARVELYNINFGEASRYLENARDAIGRASTGLKAVDRDADAARLDSAVAAIDEAQRLARQLNQDANSRAADVAKTLAAVLASDTAR